MRVLRNLRPSCCGSQNLCAALTAASNFDRCHSFLLAASATSGARKRPRTRVRRRVQVACLPNIFAVCQCVKKGFFDTLKGCRDFPCTLSLCALRRVIFPKSQNARFLRCKASYIMECPKLQEAWERHTLRCAAPMLHVACASRSAARRASALLSRQTGCCRALRRSRSLPAARHDCPFR